MPESVFHLRSEKLAVEIRPAEGGRIASLLSLSSGLEFLTQTHRTEVFAAASLHARFQQGPCAGIEECLPTVGTSGPETAGGPVPDHGDFWQLRWSVSDAAADHLTLSADGFSRPLRFRKIVSLEDNLLRNAYTVQNIGATAESFLYACHPLFAVDPGDRIVLPPEVDRLRLDYTRNGRLGTPGVEVSWPVTAAGQPLDVVGQASDGTADMFYTGRLSEGFGRIYRIATGQSLDVLFDTRKLPYLGLWTCCGGWPEDQSIPPQYAVALEPTCAPQNNLLRAQQAGTAISLSPGELFSFDIAFRVSDPQPLRSSEAS